MANSALFDLSGRVVIVTGGARGIGLVYCERLAAAGARVVPADIELAETERAAGQIMRDGGEALAAHCDVADAKSVAAMVAAVVARYGRVDALINNAALMSSLPAKPYKIKSGSTS